MSTMAPLPPSTSERARALRAPRMSTAEAHCAELPDDLRGQRSLCSKIGAARFATWANERLKDACAVRAILEAPIPAPRSADELGLALAALEEARAIGVADRKHLRWHE